MVGYRTERHVVCGVLAKLTYKNYFKLQNSSYILKMSDDVKSNKPFKQRKSFGTYEYGNIFFHRPPVSSITLVDSDML